MSIDLAMAFSKSFDISVSAEDAKKLHFHIGRLMLAAQREEREACAIACEETKRSYKVFKDHSFHALGADQCAQAIRARGEK